MRRQFFCPEFPVILQPRLYCAAAPHIKWLLTPAPASQPGITTRLRVTRNLSQPIRQRLLVHVTSVQSHGQIPFTSRARRLVGLKMPAFAGKPRSMATPSSSRYMSQRSTGRRKQVTAHLEAIAYTAGHPCCHTVLPTELNPQPLSMLANRVALGIIAVTT